MWVWLQLATTLNCNKKDGSMQRLSNIYLLLHLHTQQWVPVGLDCLGPLEMRGMHAGFNVTSRWHQRLHTAPLSDQCMQ